MKISIKNISDSSIEEQLKIREWRNHPDVSKYFILDYIDLETHKKWIERQKQKITDIAFFIVHDNVNIGCAYFRLINSVNNTAEWGFFLNPAMSISGVGAVVEYLIHEYAFNDLKLKKLNIEVLENNPSVLKMHKKFGYLLEGILRKNINKNGNRIDVHLFGLFDDEWKLMRNKFKFIEERYI